MTAGCVIHAYVLMTNHVHLLVTPMDPAGPARLMQSLGRRYVRYFNDRFRRTGPLWDGRYRAARVTSSPYFFACTRYIEMNPVRAGIVDDPGRYEWSSYRRNAVESSDPIVTSHPLYAALGATPAARCEAYRALFVTDVSPEVTATIRAALRGRPRLFATPYREAVTAIFGGAATSPDDGYAERGNRGATSESSSAEEAQPAPRTRAS